MTTYRKAKADLLDLLEKNTAGLLSVTLLNQKKKKLFSALDDLVYLFPQHDIDCANFLGTLQTFLLSKSEKSTWNLIQSLRKIRYIVDNSEYLSQARNQRFKSSCIIMIAVVLMIAIILPALALNPGLLLFTLIPIVPLFTVAIYYSFEWLRTQRFISGEQENRIEDLLSEFLPTDQQDSPKLSKYSEAFFIPFNSAAFLSADTNDSAVPSFADNRIKYLNNNSHSTRPNGLFTSSSDSRIRYFQSHPAVQPTETKPSFPGIGIILGQ